MASTPWGMAQHVTKLREGLWSVTTASHGGLRISLEREAEVKREFPGFIPFAGWPWLEEDCDVMIAVVLWPEAFDPAAVWDVVSRCQCAGRDGRSTDAATQICRWLNETARGEGLLRLVAHWRHHNADLWLRGGGHTDGRFWVSDWTNVASGERRSFRFTGYPAISQARTNDLDAWAAKGAEVTGGMAPAVPSEGLPDGWPAVQV